MGNHKTSSFMLNSLKKFLNKWSFFESHYAVMSHVVLFAYPIKLNISTKNTAALVLDKPHVYDVRT